MFDFSLNLEAKATAQRYIESCSSEDHVKTMEKYLELYKNKFDDFLGHHSLILSLYDKNESIIKTK